MSGCPECETRGRWRWWVVGAVVIGAAVVIAELTGCAPHVIEVGTLEPTPRIEMRQEARLALDLGRTRDSMRIESGQLPAIQVRGFRSTMQNAFERGFAPAFQLVKSGDADRTLVVEVANLTFVPTPHAGRTVSARDGADFVLVHGTVSAPHNKAPHRRRYARIAYRAVPRDGGRDVGRLAGVAHSQSA